MKYLWKKHLKEAEENLVELEYDEMWHDLEMAVNSASEGEERILAILESAKLLSEYIVPGVIPFVKKYLKEYPCADIEVALVKPYSMFGYTSKSLYHLRKALKLFDEGRVYFIKDRLEILMLPLFMNVFLVSKRWLKFLLETYNYLEKNIDRLPDFFEESTPKEVSLQTFSAFIDIKKATVELQLGQTEGMEKRLKAIGDAIRRLKENPLNDSILWEYQVLKDFHEKLKAGALDEFRKEHDMDTVRLYTPAYAAIIAVLGREFGGVIPDGSMAVINKEVDKYANMVLEKAELKDDHMKWAATIAYRVILEFFGGSAVLYLRRLLSSFFKISPNSIWRRNWTLREIEEEEFQRLTGKSLQEFKNEVRQKLKDGLSKLGDKTFVDAVMDSLLLYFENIFSVYGIISDLMLEGAQRPALFAAALDSLLFDESIQSLEDVARRYGIPTFELISFVKRHEMERDEEES